MSTTTTAPCCWGVDDVRNPNLPPGSSSSTKPDYPNLNSEPSCIRVGILATFGESANYGRRKQRFCWWLRSPTWRVFTKSGQDPRCGFSLA